MSSHAHEPREAFVTQLEGRLRDDLRRQRLAAAPRPWSWMPQSRLAAGLALVVMMVMSMAFGGGVVVATYEARLSEQRELLLKTFEQRQAIAQQRVALAQRQLDEIKSRVTVGLEPPEAVLDMQLRVSEAQGELKSIDLDMAEIQATGREPMHALSAPLVAGRDFVTERWRVEMTVPTAALALEQKRVAAAKGRVEIGIAPPSEIDEVMMRVAELASTVQVFERKLALRQTFLKGGVAPEVADLRGLEVETDLRRTALTRRIEFAQRRAQDLKRRTEIGTANPIEVAEAAMRVQELQLEMTKLDYEMLLIRKQLGK